MVKPCFLFSSFKLTYLSSFDVSVDGSILAPKEDKYVNLNEENRKQGLTMTLPRSNSSVFHAGVIGKGLKPRRHIEVLKQGQVVRNKQCLLDVLKSCSTAPHIPEEAHTPMETDNNMLPMKKNTHSVIN